VALNKATLPAPYLLMWSLRSLQYIFF